MKLEFSRQIFEKYSNIKFHKNLPSGSGVVPWGQADGETEDMAKLIVDFRNFADAPKICYDILVLFVITLVLIISLKWCHTAWQKIVLLF